MKHFLFLVTALLSSSVLATDVPMDRAILRTMDKVTGRVSTITAVVGQDTSLGRLLITVQSCYTKPPEETPENSAYLTIVENPEEGEAVEVFKGWMFSSNPALSAMEHPVYDIWVLECQSSDGSALQPARPKIEENENIKTIKNQILNKNTLSNAEYNNSPLIQGQEGKFEETTLEFLENEENLENSTEIDPSLEGLNEGEGPVLPLD